MKKLFVFGRSPAAFLNGPSLKFEAAVITLILRLTLLYLATSFLTPYGDLFKQKCEGVKIWRFMPKRDMPQRDMP